MTKVSKEANSVDADQTTSGLNWVHIVWQRGFLNITAATTKADALLLISKIS